MKAIVWTKYGKPDVLRLEDIEKPTPKANEIVIKIHATTVTAGDCEARSLDFNFLLSFGMRAYVGIRRPKRVVVLGQELAGVVDSTGADVKMFNEGDRVHAVTGMSMGAYAEYISLPESPGEMKGMVAAMPDNISFGEAAAIPVGGLEALHFLRQANIRNGQRVLILGAGGSIGTIAVQLAKNLGAQVTAVDSGAKLEMLRSIGADETIDYAKEDVTAGGNTFDVIFDIVGKSSYSDCIRTLSQNGERSYGPRTPTASMGVCSLLRYLVDGKNPCKSSARIPFYCGSGLFLYRSGLRLC